MYLHHPAVTRLVNSSATSPKVRVFAFPFAGSSASIYHPWKDLISTDIELLAYTPPGRGGRFSEPNVNRMEDLLDDAWTHFAPYLDKPYIIFGHSLGALLGFEFLQKSLKTGFSAPLQFITSARKAPHLPSIDNWTALSDAEFVAKLDELGGLHPDIAANPDLLSLLMPALRADISIVEVYQPSSQTAIDTKTTVYGGIHDTRVPESGLAEWQSYFSPEINLQMLDAGHFYLSKHAKVLTEQLNQIAKHAYNRL